MSLIREVNAPNDTTKPSFASNAKIVIFFELLKLFSDELNIILFFHWVIERVVVSQNYSDFNLT